jgi:hypothetical protein
MKKAYLKKANRVLAILQSAKAANVEAKHEAAREAGVGTWHDWSNPVRKEIDAKFLPRTLRLNARIQKVGQAIAAVKSGTTLPLVRKEIVMKRKAKSDMEREALDLANQERNIGKMDVWSEAYQKAHCDWMLRRFAFEQKYGVDATAAYNQIEQYACAR